MGQSGDSRFALVVWRYPVAEACEKPSEATPMAWLLVCPVGGAPPAASEGTCPPWTHHPRLIAALDALARRHRVPTFQTPLCRTIVPSLSRSALPYWRCTCDNPSARLRAAELTRGARAPALARAVAPVRPPSSTVLSPHTICRRAASTRCLYLAMLSHTVGGALATTPAHASAAVGLMRGARVRQRSLDQ